MHPAVARRRFFDQARQLRLDPFRWPIGSAYGGQCSRSRLARKGRRKVFLLPIRLEWVGEPMRSDGRPRHGGRVLVCDDKLLMAEVVAAFLSECGLQPMGPIGRLESSMQMARERAFDAAALDINFNGRP